MTQRSPQPNVAARGSEYAFPPRFWMLVVLSGIAAGIGGGLLMRLLHAVEHLCYSYNSGTFLAAAAHVSPERRVLVLLLAGIFAAAVLRILKLATGRTGADLSESIWFRSGKLPLVRTLAGAVLSIITVGMGVSLGREGALKQTGAAIASRLSQRFGLPPAQRRLLVACAAGAGMAAAYNVPFGGAIFAVEVLLGSLSLPLILPALATSFIAVAVSWLLLPNAPTYHVPIYTLHLTDVLWACIAAPILGLAAFVWLRAIVWANASKPKGWGAQIAPVLVFTLLGVAAIAYPEVLGNGKGLVQLAYVNDLNLKLLLPLFALKFIAAPACLSTGSPGGLFTPTLTVGALLGGILGHLWTLWVPGTDIGVFAIIGSAALLAASTQGPVSSVAFILELTQRVDSLMVPMLLAIVGASLVTEALDSRSIYSAAVKSGMNAAEKKILSGTAFDRFSTQTFSVATSAAFYSTLMQRKFGQPGPMFVIDNEGKLVGEIRANDLIHLDSGVPRALTTASDLARLIDPILSTATEAEAAARLGPTGSPALPVVDPQGKLIGAVTAPTFAGKTASGSTKI